MRQPLDDGVVSARRLGHSQPKLRMEQERFQALRRKANEYQSLEQRIAMLDRRRDIEEPVKTLVDVGEGFHMKARVHDPSRVHVALGLGILVEMSHDEAKAFIRKKVEQLER